MRITNPSRQSIFCPLRVKWCLLASLALSPDLWAQTMNRAEAASGEDEGALEVSEQEPDATETAPEASTEPSKSSEPMPLVSDIAINDAEAFAFLRETEARAASGQRLSAERIVQIQQMTSEDFGVRVRQKALTLLPWFPSEATFRALQENLSAPEASLRVESMAALLLLYHRLPKSSLPTLQNIARTGLWDQNDDVACRASALYRQVDTGVPDFQSPPMQKRLQEISAARYACFRENFSLPPRQNLKKTGEESRREDARAESSAQQTVPEKATDAPAPVQNGRFLPGRTGDAMVYAAALGGGAIVGGLLPTLVIPAEERLVYAPLRSRYQRTEASFWVSSAAALGGAALAGAGVWALQQVQDGITPAQGMGMVLGTWAGGLGGLGATLLTGSQGATATLAVTGGVLFGMTSSLAAQYFFPPTWQDSVATTMLASQVAMLGTLGALALVPPSASAVLGATRLDFAFGTGLFVGGLSTALSQWILPLAKPNYSRLWAAGLVSSVGAATGLWIGSLPWAAGLGSGAQWGCVFGAGLQVVSGIVAYYWLPPAWARWLTPKTLHQQAASESERAELSRQLFPSIRRERVGERSVVFLDFVDFRF